MSEAPSVKLRGISASNTWQEVIDFEALARHGMTGPRELELFRYGEPDRGARIGRGGIR